MARSGAQCKVLQDTSDKVANSCDQQLRQVPRTLSRPGKPKPTGGLCLARRTLAYDAQSDLGKHLIC